VGRNRSWKNKKKREELSSSLGKKGKRRVSFGGRRPQEAKSMYSVKVGGGERKNCLTFFMAGKKKVATIAFWRAKIGRSSKISCKIGRTLKKKNREVWFMNFEARKGPITQIGRKNPGGNSKGEKGGRLFLLLCKKRHDSLGRNQN